MHLFCINISSLALYLEAKIIHFYIFLVISSLSSEHFYLHTLWWFSCIFEDWNARGGPKRSSGQNLDANRAKMKKLKKIKTSQNIQFHLAHVELSKIGMNPQKAC